MKSNHHKFRRSCALFITAALALSCTALPASAASADTMMEENSGFSLSAAISSAAGRATEFADNISSSVGNLFGSATQVGTSDDEEKAGNNYFKSLNANQVNITNTDIYNIQLQAKDGWQFDVADNTDVTDWIVDASGNVAFPGATGIAFAVNGENFTLNIRLDASKIAAFPTNGSGNLYVKPTGGNPLIVEGNNKGQYVESTEFVGIYTIPKVVVEGTIEGESGAEYTFTNDTVTISLELEEIDDNLIDSNASVVALTEGDGYYLSDFTFAESSLAGEWSNGKKSYTMTPDDFTADFSPLGGDGNGNYYANITVSGIYYNGLPLADAAFRVHVYSYGRTFTIEGNGSLINDTQPLWSTTAKDGIPVFCDAYPDDLIITWPIDFNASALTEKDFTLTMRSAYGDELQLQPGTDFTVESSSGKTTITVSYIYWANIPVYTTLNVNVATDHLTWDSAKYTVKEISHSYDIASVYCYYIMTGGMTGTQHWTYYGVDGLTEWAQAFVIPTYTLTYTKADGTVLYYTEDAHGRGMFTEAADEAKAFDATKDNNCQVVDNTGSFERVYNQTQTVTVGGKSYICNKVYANADNMPLAPADCTGITAKAGYVLGDSWEMHGRWPWHN